MSPSACVFVAAHRVLLVIVALVVSLVVGIGSVDNRNAAVDNRYVEVGTKDLTVPRQVRSETSSQWFGSDLGAPPADRATGAQVQSTQRQIDGFDLADVRARHDSQKNHAHLLEEQDNKGQHHKILANAGIPILQASREKPGRGSWPRDVGDAAEPGDGAPVISPSDLAESPGDALLEISTDMKPSLLRREMPIHQVSVDQDFTDVLAEIKRQSDCDSCQNCSEAIPNLPMGQDSHADGVWCMCFSWAEWQTKNHSAGHYPGPDKECTEGCQKVAATGVDCDALNCSCALNVQWASSAAA